MKIFITGATGYIGNGVMQRLLTQGHEVHALARHPNDPLFACPGVQVHEGDLLNKASLKKAVSGCQQVYHLAGFARPWASNPKTYFDINVQGTMNVLDAAWSTGIERLVFSSSCAVFGRSNGSPVDERHLRDFDFCTEYESSKQLAEEQILRYSLRGMHSSIVCPSKVYGPGIWTEGNALSQLILSYMEGNWHVIPGDGKTVGCFCFIDDVIQGHLLAMNNGRSGEKYILGGENISFDEFFQAVKVESGHNFLMIHIPITLMKLFGLKEELQATWFGRKPKITRKWITKYKYDLSCSSEKAISELGYTITPFREGLSRTVKWIENEKCIYSLKQND